MRRLEGWSCISDPVEASAFNQLISFAVTKLVNEEPNQDISVLFINQNCCSLLGFQMSGTGLLES